MNKSQKESMFDRRKITYLQVLGLIGVRDHHGSHSSNTSVGTINVTQ